MPYSFDFTGIPKPYSKSEPKKKNVDKFMIDKYSTKKTRSASIVCLVALLYGFVYSMQKPAIIPYTSPPSLKDLTASISKAQAYYEGLYKPFPNNTGVVIEYYTNGKTVYTVRHGVIGGIFYYDYIHQATQSAALKKFALANGFNPSIDDHSFIWTKTSSAPEGIVYTADEYQDCRVSLPSYRNISPYHSKVCKTGLFGISLYLLFSRLDPLLPIENTLQKLELGKKVDSTRFEQLYNDLGFGIPMCSPLGCSSVASTIRTAQFGELELRLHKTAYASAVAANLLKAQDKNGAIYISYDKKGKLDSKISFAYKFLDMFLNDKPLYRGYIPSNAETMNDSLAFLMHYRCQEYKVCN